MRPYRLAAATAPGRDHVLRARNRQDAYAVIAHEEALIGVVCDGCGSSAASEVGATLAAGFLAAQADALLRAGHAPQDAAVQLYGCLLDFLHGLLALYPPTAPEARLAFIRDHLLFTALGVILSEAGGVVFAAGDGLLRINDAVHALEADNAPPYPAYHLVPREARADTPLPEGFDLTPLPPDVACVGLATDGFEAALLAGLGGLGHPRKLQRMMNVWAEREKRFADDATVLFLEREEQQDADSSG